MRTTRPWEPRLGTSRGRACEFKADLASGALASIDYWFSGADHRVHKVVHHFLLEAIGGELTTRNDPDHEAEEAAWIPLKDSSHRLAYPNERRIVTIALDLLYRGL